MSRGITVDDSEPAARRPDEDDTNVGAAPQLAEQRIDVVELALQDDGEGDVNTPETGAIGIGRHSCMLDLGTWISFGGLLLGYHRLDLLPRVVELDH
jgi:hypothetical protein